MINKIRKLFRSGLVIFLFGFFGVGALFVQSIKLPSKKNKIEKYKTLQRSWKFFVWLLRRMKVINLEIDDIERLKNIKQSIIVSTHPSFIDIVILISLIPDCTCFVADRLAQNPFFGKIVRELFISEGLPSEEWLKECNRAFEEGLNVIIFPMGIRHRKEEHPKIRRGAALLAQKSKKDIIMLNLETDFDFLQIHQPFYEAGVKAVTYSLSYTGEIETEEYLKNFPDEVSFRTEITKKITKSLYK